MSAVKFQTKSSSLWQCSLATDVLSLPVSLPVHVIDTDGSAPFLFFSRPSDVVFSRVHRGCLSTILSCLDAVSCCGQFPVIVITCMSTVLRMLDGQAGRDAVVRRVVECILRGSGRAQVVVRVKSEQHKQLFDRYASFVCILLCVVSRTQERS